MQALLKRLSELLDSVPQVPQDYSNHGYWGLALGVAAFCAAYPFTPLLTALEIGVAVPTGLCALKKLSDRIVKGESVTMCVGKTLMTGSLPFLVLLGYLAHG